MRWLLSTPLRPFVGLAATASLLLNLAMIVPSLFTLQVFDRVFASRSLETLGMLCVITGLALCFAYAMDVARSRALAQAGRAVSHALSGDLLAQAVRRCASGQAVRGADSLRDAARLRAFLEGSGVRALFDAPWVPVYVLVIGLMHPLLGAAAALAGAALLALAMLTERLTRAQGAALSALGRETARGAERLVRDGEVLVAMGMTRAAVAGWRAHEDDLLAGQQRFGLASARLAAFARFLRQLVQIAVLALGAWLVVAQGGSPGIMVAATVLLGRALQPVEQLIAGWKQFVEARAAWKRLLDEPAPAAAHASLSLPAPRGQLDLERVVFAHSDGRVFLKAVSLAIRAGESLGITGPSGSGKTTLGRVMLGLARPISGAVRLDGAELTRWDPEILGSYLGYLPQRASLLPATVAQNIARLGPLDSPRVVEAARLARVHELILQLPQGYDTRVGEGGLQLSGGQEQRIALARALYGEARMVVLDEPDAHLDGEGQAALKQVLVDLKARGITVVVVAHRPNLLACLDRVAVLEAGTVKVQGPSAMVLSTGGMATLHALRATALRGGSAA